MPFYFAYGSNMLRSRIEERLGLVRDLGRAVLRDRAHRFDKHGRDGTAKGNIVAEAGSAVHGVLYELTDAQLERLAAFEGGYRRIECEVDQVAAREAVSAFSFEAIAPVTGMRPSAEYLDCYERGMIEHGIPEDYRARVLREGRGEHA